MNSIISSLIEILSQKLFPEEHFITLLCRKIAAGRTILLKKVIPKKQGSWVTLLHLIRQNGLQAIIDVSKNVYTSLPEAVRHRLIADRLYTFHHAETQNKKFLIIMRNLHRAGVRLLIMKTLPVAKRLFGTDAHKISGDLDILLSVSEVQRAATVLIKLGYRCYWNHEQTHENTYIAQDFYVPRCEHIFKKGDTTVELHTAIVNTSSFTSRILSDYNNRLLTQELYNQKLRRLYHGVSIYIFSPTALFISLLIHLLYQHNFQSVVRYYELFRVVRSYKKSIRWNEVLRLIQTHHLTPYFYWFVCLFNDLFPDSLPKDIVQSAQKNKTSFRLTQLVLYSIIKHRLFHPSDLPFGDNEKRACWAIINKQFFSSVLSFLQRRLFRL